MRALVVGGGLAGIAAALDLVDAGHAVTLLEARPSLGGAVHTLPEREGDPPPPPDNGQHIALGCCTAYLEFLERIGQSGAARRTRLALPVIAENGRVSLIQPGPLALLRYRHVSLRDRIGIGRAARALDQLEPEEHDDVTFADLLRSLGSSDAAIERFWDVFIRPGLNLRSEEVSAGVAIFTVRTALLAGGGASDLVLPEAPLGAMHGDAAEDALRTAGAEVRTRARVTALDGRTAVLADGERIQGDGIVVALPRRRAPGSSGSRRPSSRTHRSSASTSCWIGRSSGSRSRRCSEATPTGSSIAAA
jgi:protoporphyrinogen oxidase